MFLTLLSAYVPLGIFNGIINMTIAATKVALAMLFFEGRVVEPPAPARLGGGIVLADPNVLADRR